MEQETDDHNKRGYDYETVEEPPEDCLCTLCELLVRNPQQTECCGRIFCEYCLEQYKKGVLTYRCPNCRSPLKDNYFKDLRTERAVMHTIVYCVNKSEGCDWTGKTEDMENHIGNGCNVGIITCEACNSKMKRKQLNNHLKNHCPKRYVFCQHCKMGGAFNDISTEHLNECPKAPISCLVNDCHHKVIRCDMNHHLEVCPKMIINCPHQAKGCFINFKREDTSAHCLVCPKRLYKCTYCKYEGTYDFVITKHTEECQEILVACKNRSCKEKVRRSEMKFHQQTCPKRIVNCPYNEIGCKVVMKYEELEKHEEKMIKNHLRLALYTIQARESRNHESHQLSGTVLKLENFSKYKQSNTNWLSDGFYSGLGGYKAKLNVLPNGKGQGEGNHLSAFVILTPGQYDDMVEWPFRGETTITLLNQFFDSDHQVMKMFFTESRPQEGTVATHDHGGLVLTYEQPNSSIYDNAQYILNDTLYFRVTIEPASFTKPWLACEHMSGDKYCNDKCEPETTTYPCPQ